MKSFWNFLKKNKLYGAINLVGLTVSMAFVLLSVPLQIAERGLLHAASLPVCDLPLFYQLRAEK